MKQVIKLQNVTFKYQQQADHAVHDLTFTINKGDFAGVIGPNGSGKSTAIKLILGILKPHHGKIELFGTPIERFKDWKKIGYVPQNIALMDPNFPANVYEIVRMGLVSPRVVFKRNRTAGERIMKALARVSMQDFAGRKLSQLSGGQQQRVMIARALVSEPEVLILDEPTAEVDIEAQREFYDLLKLLHKKSDITIMLISHDIGLITKIVNKVICLNRTLQCFGAPNKMMSKIDAMFGEKEIVRHHHV